VEEALEAEVEDALGKGYYEQGAATGAGYRNGYRTGRLKTAEGPIAYAAPQDREPASALPLGAP
jgi:putative transposase